MRSDPAVFAVQNEASTKKPRFVIGIEYDVESIYMTSHADISGVPGVVIPNVLRRPSAVSQRIVPDEGRSEIGSFAFSLIDLASAFTLEVRSKLGDGKGLRGKKVRFWVGYKPLVPEPSGGFGDGGFGDGGFGEGEGDVAPDSVFSTFQLFQTQIITNASYDDGIYTISCADITREQRKDIFDPKTTTLRDSVTAESDVIPVYNTAGFQPVYHGSSYSDGPNGVYGYVKIQDEWIRYSGKTPDTFTGCARGRLNTKAVAHTVDAGADADRRPKVEEGIYLELPAVKLVYAILTGIIHGTSPLQTLPEHWHLGIDPDLVRLSDMTGIGADLWDPSLDTEGFVVRFQGLSKTDGKKFLESELYMLLGCYSPIYSDGAIGLKRMNQVLADAAYTVVLDGRNVIRHDALNHDLSGMHNRLQIDWNWDGDRFTRSTLFVDAQSISIHGPAPLKTLRFKGLHGSRHTEAIIRKRLDAFRDRYTSPPETTKVSVLSSLNRLEVGDIIRDRMANVRDYAGTTQNIDRSFEIQQRSCDYITGDVELELFGSTGRASVVPPSTVASALPDAYYTAQGVNINTICTIVVVGGVGVIQPGTYNLPGNADMNASGAVYYYPGDLELSDGATLTVNNNTQIRVMGFFTVNGVIDGIGRGKLGQPDTSQTVGTPPTGGLIDGGWIVSLGLPGFIGNSRGMDGIGRYPRESVTIACGFTAGENSAFPFIDLTVSGNELLGIPSDLRGTSGGPGGESWVLGTYAGIQQVVVDALGGTGANSGAGLAIISRGFALGASGTINTSGADSVAPAVVNNRQPGAGGGGSPGGFLLLVDGSGNFFPDIGGGFIAQCGEVPIVGTILTERRMLNDLVVGDPPYAGYVDESIISGDDLSNSAHRIQYVPEAQAPQEDDDRPAPPYNLQLYRQFNDRVLTWTPPPDYDSVEIYASLTNNRPDAVLIGEVLGSSFVYAPPPDKRGVLYYWIRAQRDDVFSEWFPVSASGGVSIDSSLPDPQRIVPDPEFALSATLGAYWVASFSNSSPGFTVDLYTTGGIAGGVARLVCSGSTNGQVVLAARRIPAMQATTLQVVEVTLRWRRTTAISNSSTVIRVLASLAETEDPQVFGSTQPATLLSAAGADQMSGLNSVTVNQWQEIRAVFRLQNNPKNQTQLPYLRVGVLFDPANDESGTVEFDRLDAIFGTVI